MALKRLLRAAWCYPFSISFFSSSEPPTGTSIKTFPDVQNAEAAVNRDAGERPRQYSESGPSLSRAIGCTYSAAARICKFSAFRVDSAGTMRGCCVARFRSGGGRSLRRSLLCRGSPARQRRPPAQTAHRQGARGLARRAQADADPPLGAPRSFRESCSPVTIELPRVHARWLCEDSEKKMEGYGKFGIPMPLLTILGRFGPPRRRPRGEGPARERE